MIKMFHVEHFQDGSRLTLYLIVIYLPVITCHLAARHKPSFHPSQRQRRVRHQPPVQFQRVALNAKILRMKMLHALVLVLIASGISAQNIENQLKRASHNVEFAVLPIWYNDPNFVNTRVVGTGFLVTPDGYFITAAHVLEQYKPKSAQVTAGLRQRSGDMSGLWFDVIEKDEAHDLALCRTAVPLAKFAEQKKNPGTEHPTASLRLSTSQPVTGEFIAIAGFPLGSWNPAVQ